MGNQSARAQERKEPKPKARPATPTGESRLTRQEKQIALEERRMAHDVRLAKVDVVYRVVRIIVMGSVVAACFYFVSEALKGMAGKTTSLSALVDMAFEFEVSKYVAYSIAAVCGAGWLIERRARKKTIRGQAQHIKELESRLDPKRRSSGLLPDGSPQKEDQDA